MWKEIEIPTGSRIQGASRGRNRNFTLARLVVMDEYKSYPLKKGTITIYGRSARNGHQSPVILSMDPIAAEALGADLLAIALTRADRLHRLECIVSLKALLEKLESENTGEFREFRPGVDRETPHTTRGM